MPSMRTRCWAGISDAFRLLCPESVRVQRLWTRRHLGVVETEFFLEADEFEKPTGDAHQPLDLSSDRTSAVPYQRSLPCCQTSRHEQRI